ncbi:MAG: type II secretion system protein [Patescibacteria group bacterium]|nr:type II secretion system protein [Patescibacteria group bacterium]
MSQAKRAAKGFTLIELLIVIGIIGFLAAAILVAVDPVRRISEARNARRWAEVNAVLNAVLTYQVDARALYQKAFTASVFPVVASDTLSQMIVDGPDAVTDPAVAIPDCTTAQPACPAGGATVNMNNLVATNCYVNLHGLVPTYIASVPIDPTGGATYTAVNTGYYFRRSTAGRITVGACGAELTSPISVTR